MGYHRRGKFIRHYQWKSGSIEDYPMTGGMLMRGVIFGQSLTLLFVPLP